MKKVVLLLVVLAMAAVAFAQSVTYTSTKSGFSATFIGQPKVTNEAGTTEEGDKYSAEVAEFLNDDLLESFSVAAYPYKVSDQQITATLVAGLEAVKATPLMKPTVNTALGRTWVLYAGQDGDLVVYLAASGRGSDLLLMVVVVKKGQDNTLAGEFLRNIKITERK